MARRVRDEPCMFCGTAPCSCGNPAAIKPEHSVPVVPVVETAVAVQPSVSVPVVQYSNAITIGKPKRGQTDTVMAYAVDTLILSGIVHPSEIKRLRSSIGRVTDPSLMQSVRRWKDRRNAKGTGTT